MIGSYGRTIEPFGSYGSYNSVSFYQLNGFSNKYVFSAPILIPENVDFSIGFTIKGDRDVYEGLLESSTRDFWLRMLPSSQFGNFQGYMESSYFGAVPHSSSTVRDGTEKRIVLYRTSGDVYLKVVGVSDTLVASSNVAIDVAFLGTYSNVEFGGYIYDFDVEVDGVLTNAIPLNVKSQGSTQLPTVGSITAEIADYNETDWS